jgi:hypothetical protein
MAPLLSSKKTGNWVDVEPLDAKSTVLLQVPLFLRLAAKEDKITEKSAQMTSEGRPILTGLTLGEPTNY